jgi:hypothetical protein
MGKVKQLFQEMWEEKLLAEEKHYASGSSGGSPNKAVGYPQDSQELAQYTKEFEEWLDAYEKSFADKEGKLP